MLLGSQSPEGTPAAGFTKAISDLILAAPLGRREPCASALGRARSPPGVLAHCSVGLKGLGPWGFQTSPCTGGWSTGRLPFPKTHLEARAGGAVCVAVCAHVFVSVL